MKKRLGFTMGCTLLFVLLLGLPAIVTAAEKSPGILSFATLPQGSSSYAVTVVVSDVMSRFSGHKVTVEPVGPPGKFWPLMESGEVHMGFGAIITTENILKRMKLTSQTSNIRAIGSGQYTPNVFLGRGDAGIESIADLKGKKVLTHFTSDTHNRTVALVLDHYGLTGKVTELKITSPPMVYTSLTEGRVDAAFFSLSAQAAEVKRSRGLKVLGFPEDVVNEISKKEPSLMPYKYPKGFLGLLDKDTPTIAYRLILFIHKNVPDNVVFDLMKALNEHPKELKAGFALAAEYTMDEIPWETTLPFHPGAIRFYKEKGKWNDRAEVLQKRLLAGK
ncbi:MAG: TAXI family TRAP transporter solute-binding subunit [Desulfobacterales bacterium]|nr:TAXI family TRAP transporter solute-binding subunit [Desulfobacterales bacterium]